MRAIALGFLSAVGSSPAAARLRQQVYHPGAWFGLGLRGRGWRGVGDYVGKIVLCSALEAVVGFGVWSLESEICLWIGRRWYGWGRL